MKEKIRNLKIGFFFFKKKKEEVAVVREGNFSPDACVAAGCSCCPLFAAGALPSVVPLLLLHPILLVFGLSALGVRLVV